MVGLNGESDYDPTTIRNIAEAERTRRGWSYETLGRKLNIHAETCRRDLTTSNKAFLARIPQYRTVLQLDGQLRVAPKIPLEAVLQVDVRFGLELSIRDQLAIAYDDEVAASTRGIDHLRVSSLQQDYIAHSERRLFNEGARKLPFDSLFSLAHALGVTEPPNPASEITHADVASYFDTKFEPAVIDFAEKRVGSDCAINREISNVATHLGNSSNADHGDTADYIVVLAGYSGQQPRAEALAKRLDVSGNRPCVLIFGARRGRTPGADGVRPAVNDGRHVAQLGEADRFYLRLRELSQYSHVHVDNRINSFLEMPSLVIAQLMRLHSQIASWPVTVEVLAGKFSELRASWLLEAKLTEHPGLFRLVTSDRKELKFPLHGAVSARRDFAQQMVNEIRRIYWSRLSGFL
jgi:hypothetical protein